MNIAQLSQKVWDTEQVYTQHLDRLSQLVREGRFNEARTELKDLETYRSEHLRAVKLRNAMERAEEGWEDWCLTAVRIALDDPEHEVLYVTEEETLSIDPGDACLSGSWEGAKRWKKALEGSGRLWEFRLTPVEFTSQVAELVV